ncbi:MAG: hypothetical protein KJ864_05150 [Candidatus Omnitrophica bacterium]|nr:hypothetical protein [Candidatus Omnitrophota bacterium]
MAVLVPDNIKSGVIKANLYDPDLNPAYFKLADYYKTAILPARSRKPKDKAVIESNVGHLQCYILGRLRDRTFFSLSEINQAICKELEGYNDRPMQLYKISRKERFLELDKPYANSLPVNDFPYIRIKNDVMVQKDYHVSYEKHFYSVHYVLCGKRVDVWQSKQTIEIYYDFKRVASHKLGVKEYGYTTNEDHMPEIHKFVKGWTPGFFLNQAIKVGPYTVKVIKHILENKRHPELGFKSSLGVLKLAKECGKQRMEKASRRSLFYSQVSYKGIKSILEQKLDSEPLPENVITDVFKQTNLFHENIRGAEYYLN